MSSFLSTLSNTVFAKNLQLKQMEAQRLQQEAAARQQTQDLADERVMRESDRAEANRDREFNRQMQVAQLQSKNLALLGKAMPQFEDPALQQGAEGAYLEGQAATKTTTDKFNQQFRLQQDKDAQAAYLKAMGIDAQHAEGELNRAQRDTFHQDSEDQFQRTFDQRNQFHKDSMDLGWANNRKPRGGNIVLGNNPYFQAETNLRKEFEQEPTVKNFREVSTQAAKIQGATDSGVGDMGLIYAYMKMLDPQSTVRESEYSAAENVRGKFDAAWNLWRRLGAGEKLTPTQRAQFKAEATMLFNQHKAVYDQRAKQFKRIAQEAGANPSNVIFEDDASQSANPAGGFDVDPDMNLEDPY